MKISNEQINALLGMISLTQEEEVDCDGCLDRMAEFVEHSLAGKTIPEGLKLIEHHLRLCPECGEEFESLKCALNTSASPNGETS